MIRSAVRIVVLVLVSAAVGLGHARYRQLPLIPDLVQLAEEKDEQELWVEQTAITLDEFVRHIEMGWLVLDARPREMFVEGHLDAPLIMNVPADEAADGFHLDRILPYQGQPIALYCSSEACESAVILWNVLQSWGFSHEVRVYHPGWNGIEAAGLPVATGPDLLP